MPFSVKTTPEPADTKKAPLIYKILLLATLISTIGGALTGVMTWVNLGFTESFYINWLNSFLTAALIIMPAGFAMMTLLSHLVGKLLPNTGEKHKNLLVGVFMAFSMESIMAGTTAASNIGFSNLPAFLSAWFNGLLAALPLGLTIMLIMNMTLKPRIDKILKS